MLVQVIADACSISKGLSNLPVIKINRQIDLTIDMHDCGCAGEARDLYCSMRSEVDWHVR